MTQGFDVIIYHIVRSRKEMYQPSDPPLVVLEGIVTLCITFVTATSSIQLALAVQTLRDLMYYKYEPREIESAHFGWNGPWVPMALFALKFTVSEKEQVPVDGS